MWSFALKTVAMPLTLSMAPVSMMWNPRFVKPLFMLERSTMMEVSSPLKSAGLSRNSLV